MLWVGRAAGALNGWDRTVLVEPVRELGAAISAHSSTTGGGTQAR